MTDQPGLRMTYDEGADALGVTLGRGRAARTQQLAPLVRADWGARGELLYVEVLNASSAYPRDELRALASPAVLLTLGEAAREAGLAPVTLRLQIRHGRLRARKQGRDWIVTLADLHTYLANRATAPSGEPIGRPARRRKGRRPKKKAAAT